MNTVLACYVPNPNRLIGYLGVIFITWVGLTICARFLWRIAGILPAVMMLLGCVIGLSPLIYKVCRLAPNAYDHAKKYYPGYSSIAFCATEYFGFSRTRAFWFGGMVAGLVVAKVIRKSQAQKADQTPESQQSQD